MCQIPKRPVSVAVLIVHGQPMNNPYFVTWLPLPCALHMCLCWLVFLSCQIRCQVLLLCCCCAVLCCAVLCCAVLCCAVLCCAVLCCAVLCCAVLCCAVLCCAVLCCAVLCCAVLCCNVFSFCRIWMQALWTSTYSSCRIISQKDTKLILFLKISRYGLTLA